MDLTDRAAGSRPAPLVLRDVGPRRWGAVRAFCGSDVVAGPGEVWWELSDPAGSEDEPPSAVAAAVPRSAGAYELVHVVVGAAAPEVVADLADQVVVLLRRTDADEVRAFVTDRAVREALIGAGFEDSTDGGDLLVLRL